MRTFNLLLLAVCAALLAPGQGRMDRYALVLEDPPLLMREIPGKEPVRKLSAANLQRKIEATQQSLRAALSERKVPVLGASHRLVNAIYVHASRDQIEFLSVLPGVARIERMGVIRRQANRALPLVNTDAAWAQFGGQGNAGSGVKIAVLDSGIDISHPSMDGSTFTAPDRYPICAPQDCEYTNGKVIVARSYVRSLVLVGDAEQSRPDDLSPRDRSGHGTAVAMLAAGNEVNAPLARVSGVAPRAFLGSYKIFGSPGVNDFTFDDVLMAALEDAVVDGMDIAVLPIGDSASWSPNDRGATCNNPGVEPCDLRTAAVENAVAAGLVVVTSAGNTGDLAIRFPGLNSTNTPGSAPSAITVGATTNSHIVFSSVRMTGGGVPAELIEIPALFGDGPPPVSPLTAPVRDVAATEPNGFACNPIGTGTLAGAIALIERGNCSFDTKVNNAQRAGAVGVIVSQSDGVDFIFPMTGLIETGIPAAMIGHTDGQSLRTFLQANPDRAGTLDPTAIEREAAADETSIFTSRGPSIGEGLIKPELVAVGTDLYVATQNYDPNSNLWSPTGYTRVQGTSFGAPLVAGAAAMVLQRNPSLTADQVKSAVTNTTSNALIDFDEFDNQIPASVTVVGAGKLNAGDAVRTTVTAVPATLSFGEVDSGSLPARTVQIANHGAETVNLNLQIEPGDARLQISDTAINLDPGFMQQITVRLLEAPPPGSYEGFLVIRGGPVTLRVPYLYLVGDGVPDNLLWVNGFTFVGNVDEFLPFPGLLFKVVDRYGVPVRDVPIRFAPAAQVGDATPNTDHLGIGFADVFLGPSPGPEVFSAEVDGFPDLNLTFEGRARLRPAVFRDGVVDAASNEVGAGLAPGSYITIFGSSLSEAFRVFGTSYLPLSLAGVSVSFDVPQQGISEPGRIHFVSETQINVVIPWELLGQNTVQMKVSIGPTTSSPVVSVPLNDHSPAFFEGPDPGGDGRRIVRALDESNQLVASNNPVTAGRVVQLAVNGLGPVTNQPPSGEPAPLQLPLAETLTRPMVTIGGWDATVNFSGLWPGFVSLYQVNAIVPAGLAPGLYEIQITIGGVTSKTAFIYVG